jgi:hypothetical protein
MERLRILFATLLLMISGVAVFGRKALASPTNPAHPQACSANTTTGATVASSGAGDLITFSSGTGTGSGGGSTGGTGGTGGNSSDHTVKPSRMV